MSGVQDELDALADTLARSVTLDGPDATLLGYSARGGEVDSARVESILTRRVPAAVLTYQRGFGVDRATGIVRVPANAELSMSARTCLPLRRGRDTVALLWVLDDERPLDAAEERTVRAAGRRICALLAPPADAEPERRLGRLFAGDVTDLAPLLPPSEVPLRFVVSSAVPPGADVLLAASSRGRALAVMTAAGSPRTRGRSVVGSSAPFVLGETDPAELAILAARAIVAADCATADPALPRAIGWDDLGPYRQLLRETRAERWPWAQPLPDDGPTELLRHTLEVYLDHAGDAGRCIAALQIHRTTYYYRLERLHSRYGVDLGDGLARTELHLALKTRRLAHARDRYGWTPALLARL